VRFDVRFWHLADICDGLIDVCFWGKADMGSELADVAFWGHIAKLEHMQ
jgi:hypothetical protein